MSTAHDKHGNPIEKGDLVEVVHFGEHHTFAVEEVHESHGHFFLTGSITIRVPATATSKRKDENPKTAPREGSHVQHSRGDLQTPSPAAGTGVSHSPSHRTTHIRPGQAKPVDKRKT
jgi:hypothetical protein